MSTIAEIIAAAQRLPTDQQVELARKLQVMLPSPGNSIPSKAPESGLPADFTDRLTAHFHQAKRAALGRS